MKLAIVIPNRIESCPPQDLYRSFGLQLTRRALTSLKVLTDQDYDLILPFSQVPGPNSRLEPDPASTEAELRRLIKPLVQNTNTYLISNQGLSELKADPRLRIKAYPFWNNLNFAGYGATRNIGLIMALLSGAQAVFFMDNDAVIESPGLLSQIKNVLSLKDREPPIGGVGGLYIEQDGEIKVPDRRPWWSWCWNKTGAMNEAISLAESAPEPFNFSLVFGGNLALKRELFSKVPFDPWLPRGEDMDYRINALLAGFDLLFNAQQRVRHLPPERDPDYRTNEFIGDIRRFLYERTKAKGMDSSLLQPYPGAFMGADLRIKAGFTMISFIISTLLQGRTQSAAKAAAAFQDLFRSFQPQVGAYWEMAREWADFARSLPEEGRPEVVEEYFLTT